MSSTTTPYPTRAHQKRQATSRFSFWRFLVTTVGELLIIAGLIVGGYVVWQLWWTSVTVASDVKERIGTFQEEHPTQDPSNIATPRTDAPPIIDQPAYGEYFGVLHVPKWNWMEIPVVEGTGQELLDTGSAGHYVETQLPGELGNFALAGHRRTYGNNFRRVDILEPGDQLIMETANAYIVFEMTGNEIVSPDAYEVVLPVPNQPGAEPTERLMTLTTCHPEFGNSERFIVYNKFAYWTDKADGIPPALADSPNL